MSGKSDPERAGAARDDELGRILERAETAGEALGLLAQAYPHWQRGELLAALDAQAAALRRRAALVAEEAARVERLRAVLGELMRRLDAERGDEDPGPA